MSSAVPSKLTCPQGHAVNTKKKLKSWQGRVHERRCGCCNQAIDRNAERWLCGDECDYAICDPCFDNHAKGVIRSIKAAPPLPEWAGGRKSTSQAAEPTQVSSQISAQASERPRRSLKAAPTLQEPLLPAAAPDLEAASPPPSRMSLQMQTLLWIGLWFIASSLLVVAVSKISEAKDDEGNPVGCIWLIFCFADTGGGALLFVAKTAMERVGGMTVEGMPTAANQDKQKRGLLLMAVLACLHILQMGLGDLASTLPLCFELHILTPAVALAVMVKLRVEASDPMLIGIVACSSVGGFCAMGVGGMAIPGEPLMLFLLPLVSVAKWMFALVFIQSDLSPPPMYLAMSTLGTAGVIGIEVTCMLQWGCFWTIFNLAEPAYVFGLVALLSVCTAVQFLAELNALRLTSVMALAFLYPMKSAFFDVFALLSRQGSAPTVVQWVGVAACLIATLAYMQRRQLPESSKTDSQIKTMEECVKTMIVPGDGVTFPTAGTGVTTKYTLYLEDGTVVDEGSIDFVVGCGTVFKGWDVGVSTMSLGEMAVLKIPPRYAYGVNGLPGRVPPNATLTFKVRLLAVGDQPTHALAQPCLQM